MGVGAQCSIDWGVLADAVDLPTFRIITVEFLSTFCYRTHQVAVPEQEDEELPPDIEFSICGQHMEMSIERFSVLLSIYYEQETVTEAFTQGLTHGEDRVTRAWWPQILTRRPSLLVGRARSG
ncbi:hypothetical protein R6Q57_008864 [Mikania cordata]